MKPKNRAAVALGRLGGKAKAAKLTAEQRSESARKAGLAGGRGRPKTPSTAEQYKQYLGDFGRKAAKDPDSC